MMYSQRGFLQGIANALLFLCSLTLSNSISAGNKLDDPSFCEQNKANNVIFCIDFEKHKQGIYTSATLNQDWSHLDNLSDKSIRYNLGVSQDRVVIAERENNQLLKILYPKDSFGPWLTGATWQMPLPGLKENEAYEQVSLEYKVLFKKGFLYNRVGLFGGKLPGLMGGEPVSGGETATGKNGFTARIMWGQLGRGLGYLYYPDMKDDKYNQDACPIRGLDHELCVIKRNKYFTFDDNPKNKCISEWTTAENEFRFKTERLYKIKQHLKMNSLPADNSKQGNRDGELKIWLDDKLVVDCSNVRFRDIPTLGIDSFLFSSFFGGNTPESSAHPHDEYIYFDDFLISTD